MDFNEIINNNLFVVVWHRNHLGVMSAIPLTYSGGSYSYNFSSAEGQAYGDGHKQIDTGIWGMIAGDGNSDGEISVVDKNVWSSQAGKPGYLNGDFSMDAQVNNQDKNDFLINNVSEQSQVPD